MFCEKAVLAYDGSDVAKKALEKTMAIAETNELIKIDVLYVIELPQTPYVIEDVFEDMQKSMHEHGDAVLAEAKEITILQQSGTYAGWSFLFKM